MTPAPPSTIRIQIPATARFANLVRIAVVSASSGVADAETAEEIVSAVSECFTLGRLGSAEGNCAVDMSFSDEHAEIVVTVPTGPVGEDEDLDGELAQLMLESLVDEYKVDSDNGLTRVTLRKALQVM